jgi:hypothetical protein
MIFSWPRPFFRTRSKASCTSTNAQSISRRSPFNFNLFFYLLLTQRICTVHRIQKHKSHKICEFTISPLVSPLLSSILRNLPNLSSCEIVGGWGVGWGGWGWGGIGLEKIRKIHFGEKILSWEESGTE